MMGDLIEKPEDIDGAVSSEGGMPESTALHELATGRQLARLITAFSARLRHPQLTPFLTCNLGFLKPKPRTRGPEISYLIR